jgi:hypothetical protein
MTCLIKRNLVEFERGIFDGILDCTYVILCCGPDPNRLENVKEQLKILRPSKKVHLMFFAGYRKCDISVGTNDDLINNILYIFKEAIENGSKRIMVLEDDFFLTEPISETDSGRINDFVTKKDPDVYSFGSFCAPTVSTILSYHNKASFGIIGVAHCMMYNSDFMLKYIHYMNNNDKTSLNTDVSTKDITSDVYRYYKPLVYQKFEATENQVIGWHKSLGKCGKPLISLYLYFVRLVRLDKQPQPGFFIAYYFPLVILTIIIVCIAYKIVRR